MASSTLDRAVGGSREWRPGRESNCASVLTMPSRKAIELMWPSPTARSDMTEAQRTVGHAALVGVRHDAGVHQRRRGIAVFVAEIGADQLAAARCQVGRVERLAELFGELFVAALEHLFDLPVARVEIAIDAFKFLGDFVLAESEDILDEPKRPAGPRAGRLPGEMKGTDDDAARIGTQA